MLQTPTHVFILSRQHPQLPQIFADGRKHPEDPKIRPGMATGRPLRKARTSSSTPRFNDKFWFDFRGHPHSEQLHTLERYTRTNLGTIVVETTVTDPVYYTKPFTIKFSGRLRPKRS